MFPRGYCVMHLRFARDPGEPAYVLVPGKQNWESAESYVDEHVVAWWDNNPVFATREEAERYAWLAPVETEIIPVEYSETPQSEDDGWFDSFRSPCWFRALDDPDG